MNELLQILPVPKRSFLQKVFRQFPLETPFIELNNIAAKKGFSTITEMDVRNIEKKYQVDIRQTFALNLLEYCITYINDCFNREGWLSPIAQQNIMHMKKLFRLNEREVLDLQYKLAEPLYRRKFRNALRDGFINDVDDEQLNKLGKSLSQQATRNIRLELTNQYFNNYVSERLRQNLLSPEEDSKLEAVTSRLGMKPQMEKEKRQAWLKARALWDLQNLELPVLHTMEFHQLSEECYFLAEGVQWHEYRVRKGDPYLKHIDTGTLILTSKRLIYNGRNKVTHLKFSDIKDFIRQDDYVEIRKFSGRNPTLMLEKIDEFVIVLARLLS